MMALIVNDDDDDDDDDNADDDALMVIIIIIMIIIMIMKSIQKGLCPPLQRPVVISDDLGISPPPLLSHYIMTSLPYDDDDHDHDHDYPTT